MNWKEEIQDVLDDFQRVTANTEPVLYSIQEAEQAIFDFISTQIIEKLIEDIEEQLADRYISDEAIVSIKQQLRDKWL